MQETLLFGLSLRKDWRSLTIFPPSPSPFPFPTPTRSPSEELSYSFIIVIITVITPHRGPSSCTTD